MNSNCSKCQQTNPPSVSSNSFQIDISEIKIDMCEPENIIGPKGKTSESDNIDVVIHVTSENLSANKRESSDSDIENLFKTEADSNMITIDIDHTLEKNKDPVMNFEDIISKVNNESLTKDSDEEFKDSFTASYTDKINEFYYNMYQMFNLDILLRIMTCICFISLGYYLSNSLTGIKKFGIILLFLIILPDVYSWDIFFEVYEILIDLVTVLHQVRKIRKRSFSYLRRKLKNAFSFEETEELTN